MNNQSAVDPKALQPVLNNAVEFMEQAIKEAAEKDAQITSLKASLARLQAEQERVLLEKVAAAKASFFDKSALETTLAKLEGMGVIDHANHEKFARRIMDDPGLVLPLIIKVATMLMSAPGEGSGVEGEASLLDAGDPDGWADMARGLTVAIKR